MFHFEDSEISGCTVQDLAAWATWCLGFVHPCFIWHASFQSDML